MCKADAPIACCWPLRELQGLLMPTRCNGRFNNWINSGTKGEDFVRNLGIPQFDFSCIHVVRTRQH